MEKYYLIERAFSNGFWDDDNGRFVPQSFATKYESNSNFKIINAIMSVTRFYPVNITEIYNKI